MERFGTPEVVHTDRGTALHNELVSELLRMTELVSELHYRLLTQAKRTG